MSIRQAREIERFLAVDDNGEMHTVIIHQEFIDARSMDGNGTSWIPGLKSATLADGNVLNRVEDGAFMIVSSGKMIRRIDQ